MVIMQFFDIVREEVVETQDNEAIQREQTLKQCRWKNIVQYTLVLIDSMIEGIICVT